MLLNLPSDYSNVAQQLYLLENKEFTPENVKKKPLAEFDRLNFENASAYEKGQ